MRQHHDHDHGHEHSHAHPHGGGPGHSPEEAKALLNYMIGHNDHHGEDLHEVYHALADTGAAEAAELVHKAMHVFEDGNALLRQAMEILEKK